MQPQDRVFDPAFAKDAPLQIALVEPEIPPNTGNVARLCAATGCALHLIEPLGFRIDDRELKRAGLDYWQHLQIAIHPNLPAFLDATSSARRWYVSKRASRSYTQAEFARGDILVFGKETHGLPDDLLAREPERSVRIPMRPDSVRSLNLSTAVGIVAYAALAQIGFPNLQ
jgi:tRNA (cytidine/uridine-2'-O-)-methyltransferase